MTRRRVRATPPRFPSSGATPANGPAGGRYSVPQKGESGNCLTNRPAHFLYWPSDRPCGAPMPLSDREQQILSDIEARLRQDDPKFARTVGTTTISSQSRRQVKLAAVGFIL
ncbi:MAG: DUF3040 domain-containing protein, partial [Nitriliruptorales bacterium]|nr:DUF3040 domain-containing protein [Nitriliruptorales bacterium]